MTQHGMALQDRFESKFSKSIDGCWLWLPPLRKGKDDGYGQIKIKGRGMVRAHRISWELYKGSIPDDLCVLHTCDVRHCVNPNHLFLGTRIDNAKDMAAKGRARGWDDSGEKHPSARLTEMQVLAIRADTRKGCDIAKAFNISRSHVSGLRSGKFWRHLGEAP